MYRDARAAARERIRHAEEQVAALEARVAPELLERLPKKLRRRLSAQRSELEAVAGEAREEILRDYAVALERALGHAPQIDQAYNRLPRRFPERQPWRQGYRFPDVYERHQAEVRAALHRAVETADAEAIVYDRATAYQRDRPDPFLVEVCFRLHGAPFRLCALARVLEGMQLEVVASLGLFVLLRQSAPALSLATPSLPRRWARRLGLGASRGSGEPAFDRAFALAGASPAAEARAALLSLANVAERLALETGAGVGRLDWFLRGGAVAETAPTSLLLAAAALAAIRRAPGTRLV